MATLKSTPAGTIGAFTWSDGIAFGLYKKGNCVSLEYDKGTGKIILLINDPKIRESGIEVRHTSENWN